MRDAVAPGDDEDPIWVHTTRLTPYSQTSHLKNRDSGPATAAMRNSIVMGILALKTCSTLLCVMGTAKRKMQMSSSRRWCSLCSESPCHCCCTSVGDGSSDCVGKNSSRGDNWSNVRSRMTMGCSRLLEIQLGTTGLYHGDEDVVQEGEKLGKRILQVGSGQPC